MGGGFLPGENVRYGGFRCILSPCCCGCGVSRPENSALGFFSRRASVGTPRRGESGRFIRQTGLEPIALPGVDALVISGSGDRIRAEASAGLALPILNSLGSSEVIHTAASKVSLSFALFFYGGCDGTFDEESSRRILRSLRLDEEKKEFHILPGVDHAFRTVNGTPSFEPLEQMLGITMATLERRRRT